MVRQTSVAEAAKLDFANASARWMRQTRTSSCRRSARRRHAEMPSARNVRHQVYTTMHTNSAIGAIPAAESAC
jgi:general secretion pathway protein E/type IV pilus assembly protein PilB